MIRYIYKLSSKDADEFYIGQTSDISKRFIYHRNDCSTVKCQKRKLYSYIIENGGFNKWSLSILAIVKGSLEYCKKRERFYIEKLKPTLNHELPGRTTKEWQKDNYCKKANTEKMRKYRQIKIHCICGKIISKPEKARHEKTLWHKKFMNSSH